MREAVALKQWLVEQTPPLANEIFLDIDPESGLRAGTRWKDALRQANARCEAVICLLSGNWEASHECKVEYRTAENLNKQIFVARLEPSTGGDITSEWQRCDLFGDGATTAVDIGGGPPVEFSTEGLYRLRDGIRGAGIGADSFIWPPLSDPGRAPYRGWEPLEEIDAAVFFGRDAQIVRALDAVRGMRLSGTNEMFVVLGPSGSGKSSFLRAGLLPRLRREDRRFALLEIVRPERNVLTGQAGFAAAIGATRISFGLKQPSLGEIKGACAAGDLDAVAGWLSEIRAVAAQRLLDRGGEAGAAPTLVLPLDQAEELFSADAGEQAHVFLDLVAGLAQRINSSEIGLVVAATIRTDRYEVMQTHPALAGVGSMLFDELKPMPPTQFKEVITGPAQRASEGGANLRVSPDLVERLLSDAGEGADTLPMLALTMSRLYADYGSTGELTLSHYESLGGIRRVVQTEIDEVLATDPARRAAQLAALRSAFIPWLATVNPDNDQPMRRVSRFADLPAESRPLIDAFVAKRLMVKDIRDGQTVVEVALESLLRQWDELAGWLREQRKDLKDADDLERSATAWAANDRNSAWLLEGSRLAEAIALVNRPGFQQRLASTHEYLNACHHREGERRVAEEHQRRAELAAAQEREQAAQERAQYAQEQQVTAESHATVLRKRSRILRAVLAVTAVVAVLAAVAGVSFFRASGQAQSRFEQATSQRLVSEALAMLGDTRPGGDARAFQQLLAARVISPDHDDAALYTAVTKTVDTDKVITTPNSVNGVAVSPDGTRIASAQADHSIRIWDTASGAPVGSPLTGHSDIVWSVAFSPDGKTLVSGSEDKTVRLWDVESGSAIGDPLEGHTGVVRSVAFNPDGVTVASGSFDKMIRLWNVRSGKQIGEPLAGHTGWVFSIAFNPDGTRLASGGYDDTVRIWDVRDRTQVVPPAGGAGTVNAVAYSPDGSELVSASIFGDLMRWDPETAQPVGEPMNVSNNVIGLAFSPDGRTLAAASGDTTIKQVSPSLDAIVASPLTGHESGIFGIAYTGDGKLISGSRDATVRVWDPASSRPLLGQGKVGDVAFSSDGKSLAAGGSDPPLLMWDPVRRKQTGSPLEPIQAITGSVAFSPDGSRLAITLLQGFVLVFDTATMDLVGGEHAYPDPVLGVAFSPDGKRVAAVSSNALEMNRSAVDGKSTVLFFDGDTGRELSRTISISASAGPVAYSPDGTKLATAGNSGYIQLWDPESGEALGERFSFSRDVGISSIAFSPDGKLLAEAGADSAVRLFDTETHEQSGAPLNGHRGAVDSVEFSPDGRFLASSGVDNTVRLWDVAARQPFGAPLAGHTDAVNGVAFSADGALLASGSLDGSVRIWPAKASPDDLCARLSENMSRTQWSEWVSPDIDYVQACADLPIAPD